MKILQVATYVSPDNSYGGPVRVALNQSKELSHRGHDVTLIAAGGGFTGVLPKIYDNYPIKLFKAYRAIPGAGFAGLISPRLLLKMRKYIDGADVVHVHLARDLVTLPAAFLTLRAGKPLITQTHGMIDPSNNLLAKPLDKYFTIPVLRSSSKVLYLRSEELDELNRVAGYNLDTQYLPNGTPVAHDLAVEQRLEPHDLPEVLYLARLHRIKRPEIMVQASHNLLKSGSKARFTLAGPEEGEGPKLRNRIASYPAEYSPQIEGAIAPNETMARMRRASIYVLPSIDETFPMSVLEAMSVGLPVVLTKSCGLAKFVESHNAGITCGPTELDLGRAIRRLLEEPELRKVMGQNARRAIEENYSIEAVIKKLEHLYKQSVYDDNKTAK